MPVMEREYDTPFSVAAGGQAFEKIAMKTKILFLALIALVTAAVRLPAQTVQTLCSFNGNVSNPALTLGNDGNFYGTTSGGGEQRLWDGVQSDDQRRVDHAGFLSTSPMGRIRMPR